MAQIIQQATPPLPCPFSLLYGKEDGEGLKLAPVLLEVVRGERHLCLSWSDGSTVAIWSYADKNLAIYGNETHLNPCKYSAEILVMLNLSWFFRCTDEFEIQHPPGGNPRAYEVLKIGLFKFLLPKARVSVSVNHQSCQTVTY